MFQSFKNPWVQLGVVCVTMPAFLVFEFDVALIVTLLGASAVATFTALGALIDSES